ncbi:very short patch repair endonuclease [Quadrisphaera sp. DSM 44207]|uniref:very short patch repair endonuclease n=1 Tax=Quadrisphaera sp. DSM 44207 TaxID=1881057 RepID=UPI00088E7C89|nr:very short patch repair endonuclease [Quadrisphaera sp. DSM 44207]SDQ35335.1 T/G mismatch-specific endonuclease [Quadrisphaera sp. DSM 44207]
MDEAVVVTTRPIVVPPAPAASSPAAARTMRANRRRDTQPEVALRRELWRRGHRYLVDATPAGTSRRRRADVLLRGARIAVFVDGCFWHSCPQHLSVPKRNREWWEVKLASVRERDARTDVELRAAGWVPVRIWEHEEPRAAVDRLEVLLASGRGR